MSLLSSSYLLWILSFYQVEYQKPILPQSIAELLSLSWLLILCLWVKVAMKKLQFFLNVVNFWRHCLIKSTFCKISLGSNFGIALLCLRIWHAEYNENLVSDDVLFFPLATTKLRAKNTHTYTHVYGYICK